MLLLFHHFLNKLLIENLLLVLFVFVPLSVVLLVVLLVEAAEELLPALTVADAAEDVDVALVNLTPSIIPS